MNNLCGMIADKVLLDEMTRVILNVINEFIHVEVQYALINIWHFCSQIIQLLPIAIRLY